MADKNKNQRTVVEEFIDPLYGLIRIGAPFVSAFSNQEMEKERKRLQGIKSLGMICNQFPAGTHTKWEHYLGMFSVAGKMNYGLTKKEIDNLQWLCLLGGFGHLPCTYVSALAVFLASMVSQKFKIRLRNFIKPADDICNQCDDKEACGKKPKELVMNSYDFNALRSSLTAYKITQIPKEVGIGHRDALIRGCFCAEDKLYKIYRAISRYDYLQRDLYHTGVAKFSIDFKQVFSSLEDGIDALEKSRHMSLLEELYEYLVDILYLNPSTASLEALLAKVVAEKLCGEELTLEEMMVFDDHAFVQKLEQIIGEDIVMHLMARTPVFTVKRDVEVDVSRDIGSLKLEMELLGIKNKEKEELLLYYKTKGLAISVYHLGESDNLNSIYRIMLSALKDNKKFYPLAYAAYILKKKYLPKRIVESSILTQEIASYALGGGKVTYTSDKIYKSLHETANNMNTDEIVDIVKNVQEVLAKADIMGEEEYPTFRRILMYVQRYSRIKGRFKKQQEFRYSLIRYIFIPMLRSLLILPPGIDLMRKLWQPIINKVIKQIKNGDGDKSELIETFAYLSELISGDRNKKILGVLPSVKIIHNGEENEIDVISLALVKNEVVLKLIECTKSDSTKKATDDYSKLLGIKNLIDSQRFQDLVVSTTVIGGSPVRKDFVSIEEMGEAVKND